MTGRPYLPNLQYCAYCLLPAGTAFGWKCMAAPIFSDKCPVAGSFVHGALNYPPTRIACCATYARRPDHGLASMSWLGREQSTVFFEGKRAGHDRLTPHQKMFIEGALKAVYPSWR